jgi:hypothetical protein
MSKTQNKRQERAHEAATFIAERRKIQLAMLEQNFQIGVQLYESNKDKLSPEEIEQIEAMMAEQKASLERLKLEANPPAEA